MNIQDWIYAIDAYLNPLAAYTHKPRNEADYEHFCTPARLAHLPEPTMGHPFPVWEVHGAHHKSDRKQSGSSFSLLVQERRSRDS